MSISKLNYIILASILVSCTQLKKNTQSTSKGVIGHKENVPDLSGNCKGVRLKSVAETLENSKDPCHIWVKALYGRVLKAGLHGGSAAIVTRNTRHGTALILSAMHVIKMYPDGADREGPVDGFLAPPNSRPNTMPYLMTLFQPQEKSALGSGNRNISYPFMIDTIAPETVFDNFTTITPKQDFVLGVMTNTLVPSFSPWEEKTLDLTSVEIFDPEELTLRDHSYATAREGMKTITLGFPAGQAYAGKMHYSVGEVLSDSEAVQRLKTVDSSESQIPYESEIEFLSDTKVAVGYSGGGTFDAYGNYLGVNVRATVVGQDDLQYVRVTRASYIFEKVMPEKYSSLDEPSKDSVSPFLSKDLLKALTSKD